jgi:hypothetical protein
VASKDVKLVVCLITRRETAAMEDPLFSYVRQEVERRATGCGGG